MPVCTQMQFPKRQLFLLLAVFLMLCGLFSSMLLTPHRAHAADHGMYVEMGVRNIPGVADARIFIDELNNEANAQFYDANDHLVDEEEIPYNNPRAVLPAANPGPDIFNQHIAARYQAFIHMERAGFIEANIPGQYLYHLQIRDNGHLRQITTRRWNGDTDLNNLLGQYVNQAYALQSTGNTLINYRFGTPFATAGIAVLAVTITHIFPVASFNPFALTMAIAGALLFVAASGALTYLDTLQTFNAQYAQLVDTFRQIEMHLGLAVDRVVPNPQFVNPNEEPI